jgi:hypothetical protein
MQQYTCPSCGAQIKFQSSVSVTCVCPYCRSLVVRRDMDVEAIGVMAQLPDDISPFQLGTAGICKNIHFSLIGRMKIGWEDGSWNEWFMLTDEGKKGWLAEAQGSLAVSFEREEGTLPKTPPKLGQGMTFGGKQFFVSDVKETECIGSEGELPFAAPKGRKTIAADLISSDGGFASIEYADVKPPRFYIGEYMEFDALRFTNLRALPGWDLRDAHAQAKPQGKPAA